MCLTKADASKKDVIEQLKKLKGSKSLRPDGADARILKELKCEIAEVAMKICNISLNRTLFPKIGKLLS